MAIFDKNKDSEGIGYAWNTINIVKIPRLPQEQDKFQRSPECNKFKEFFKGTGI